MEASGSNDTINDEIQDELFCGRTRSPALSQSEPVQSSRVGLTGACVSRRFVARHKGLVTTRSLPLPHGPWVDHEFALGRGEPPM